MMPAGIKSSTQRHADQIAGVVSCYDRVLILGTLAGICFAKGMTSCLYEHKIRIFDYSRFAEPFRKQLRENAARLAADNGLVFSMAILLVIPISQLSIGSPKAFITSLLAG